MKFQMTYKITPNMTFQDVEKLGYKPEWIPSSRNEEIYTDNFTFRWLPNVKVNVYPKEGYSLVQVYWNSVKEKKDNQSELVSFLSSENTKTLSARRLTLNLKILYDDDFLEQLEILYSKYVKKADEREKLMKKYEFW